MATAKGFKGASSKSGASGSAREAMELPEWVMKKIEDLKDTMRLAKSPAELQLAAKEYDEVMKAISSDLRINGRQVAPNAKTITYDVGGGKFISRPRGEPAPDGGKPINLSMEEVTKILPPRPVVPENIVNKAEEVVSKAAPKPGEGPWGERPAPPPPWSGYGSKPAPETPPARGRSEGPWGQRPPAYSGFGSRGTAEAPEAVQTAKEVLGTPRPTPTIEQGPWGAKVNPAPSITPIMPRPNYTPREVPLGDVLAVPGAIGAGAIGTGVMYGANPEATEAMLRKAFNTVTGGTDVVPNNRTESPNLDNIPYMGPGASVQPDDFRGSGIPFPQPQGVSFDASDFAPNGGMMDGPMTPPAPDYSGRELPGRDIPYQVTPNTPIYSGRELGSNTTSQLARQVIQRAQNTPAAQAQRAAEVLQQSPNQLTVQKGPEQGGNALTRFIRGDFSEGADQRIMEAMRRQREESGVDSSKMASGGAASKKTNKDDVLHKALEIIHHMLTRR